MSDKISTYGVKLYRTSIALANEVPGIIDIEGINLSRPAIDATTHDDTWRTKIAGLYDPEPLTVKLALDPQDTTHALFLGQVATDSPSTAARTWVMTAVASADGTKKSSWTFTAHNGNWREGSKTVDGLLQAEFQLIIATQPTYDADETTVPA